MNWNKFKHYLEENILQKNDWEEGTETDNKEEETAYTLRPEAKSKYSIQSEKELINALSNLIASIDNQPCYSFSNTYSPLSEQDNNYCSLPSLNNLVNDQGQVQKWTDYFPQRAKVKFGKKSNNLPKLSIGTYNLLAQIFQNWAQQVTRKERLTALVSEENIMMKFLLEAAISLNYDLIKRKGYDIQLKNWQTEYNQLGDEEKENLTKQKELVDKLLATYEEETANRQEQTWYQNINWKKYGLIGGGIILVIFLLIWIFKQVKNVIT
jgi:Txe/YoeB family toxin of Txe-Axe toxin-antitoxin module